MNSIDISAENSFASALRDSHYPWASTMDMIQNILSLMQESRWTRNYLLDNTHKRSRDASILSSTEHTKHAYTRTCRREDSDGSYFTQMFVPAYSNGTIGVGVVAGYSSSSESSFLCGSSRFASDTAKGSALVLHIDTCPHTIVVIFQSSGTIERNYAYLKFPRAAFLRATGGHGDINFDLLHRSLLVSCCGGIPGTNMSPAICNSNRNGTNMVPDIDIFGTNLLRKYNKCAYVNTVPVMAFKTERIDSWNSHLGPFEIERLKQMGIAAIKRKNIPIRIPLEIAPAPGQKHNNVAEVDESMARKERRKIKKRESAARSYARKREKRIAALRQGWEAGNEQSGEKLSEGAPNLQEVKKP